MADSTIAPPTDADLVVQARQGSQNAYREILQRYQRPVYNLVVRMVRDPSTAEDVAQEAFVKAFRALASYDPRQRFSSWMFKIAHNTAVDLLRRKPLATVALESGEDEEGAGLIAVLADETSLTPEQETLRVDLRRALERGLAALRPDYRTVLVLRFHEGLAYEEIAEVTGLPLGTVKTHIHRGRKELAAHLSRRGFSAGAGTPRPPVETAGGDGT